MNSIANLFKGDNLVPALIVAVAAFLLGVVVEMIICKLACKCGGKKGGECRKAAQKPQRKEEHFEKRHPAPADGSIEIYVGNVSYDLTEDQLRAAFEAYGKRQGPHGPQDEVQRGQERNLTGRRPKGIP